MSVHFAVSETAAHVSLVAADSGPGRLGANIALLFALAALVIGGLALAGARGRIGFRPVRPGAFLAIAAGLTGAVLSVVHLARTVDGFGTGNGRAGAIIALVLAQVGVNLGILALSRLRQARPA